MKKLNITKYILGTLVVITASCSTPQKATQPVSSGNSNDSKETFVPLSSEQHVKNFKLKLTQLQTIQMYCSKAFQLTVVNSSESPLVENGALVLKKSNLSTIIKFNEKVKGKVVSFDGTSITVQFDNGENEKNVPTIKFSPAANGYYQIVTKNGTVSHGGINYAVSATDVVLLIKYKETTKSGQDPVVASGLEVNGSLEEIPTGTPSGEQPPQEEKPNPFYPDENKKKSNESVQPD